MKKINEAKLATAYVSPELRTQNLRLASSILNYSAKNSDKFGFEDDSDDWTLNEDE